MQKTLIYPYTLLNPLNLLIILDTDCWLMPITVDISLCVHMADAAKISFSLAPNSAILRILFLPRLYFLGKTLI